jgi:hypothetical protein
VRGPQAAGLAAVAASLVVAGCGDGSGKTGAKRHPMPPSGKPAVVSRAAKRAPARAADPVDALPPALAAALSRGGGARSRIPWHVPNGATCFNRGYMNVNAPYAMFPWIRRRGRVEQVRFQALLYVYTRSGWRYVASGSLFAGAAGTNGLITFANGQKWFRLTRGNPSGYTFSGLGGGYAYAGFDKFIWPAGHRAVIEPAGDHYVWSTGQTGSSCVYR